MKTVAFAKVGTWTTDEEALLNATWADFSDNADAVYFLDAPNMPTLRRKLKADAPKACILYGVEAAKVVTKIALSKVGGAHWYLNETYCAPTWDLSCLADFKTAGRFDFIYDHIKRVASLMSGEFEFPPVDGHKIEWEFIGHNGLRGDDPDKDFIGPRLPAGYGPKVWSGYFEHTEEEVERQDSLLEWWIKELESEKLTFALDTESFNLDHFDPLTMIQVYDSRWDKAFAFTWGVIKQSKELWQQFLRHPNATFVLHNTKHDRKIIRYWLDVDLGDRDQDTMCWAMGLTEKGGQCGLKYCSRFYCGAPFYEESLDDWVDWNKVNFGHIRPDILAEYGCADVYYTDRLYPILRKLVEAEGTTYLVEEILLPAQRTLSDVEYTGTVVDLAYAKEKSAEWQPIIDEAIVKVQDYARSVGFPRDPKFTSGQSYTDVCDCVPARGRFHLEGVRVNSYSKRLRQTSLVLPDCEQCGNKRYVRRYDGTLNVSSWAQMQHLCYDILQMEETPDGKKCNKVFWEINSDHPFAKLVLEYRELHFLRRNFLEGVQQFVRRDGRVHPDFLLFGTKTGRLAIHNPAMQTIPSRSKNAKYIKRVFVPTEGYVIVNADYKSLEMWVNAYLTEDPQLLDDLGSKDMYKATAMEMFSKAYEYITDEERQAAKPVVLGSGYGIGAKKLSKQPGIREVVNGDTQLTKDFIDAFWQRYNVWRDTGETWREEVLQTQRLTTEFGRKRRWALISPDNIWKVKNQAINFKGQSTASDITLTSLVKLHEKLKRLDWGRVILTVHDSLVFEIRKEKVHEAVKLIRRVMGSPDLKKSFHFAVDIGVGTDYAMANHDAYDRKKDYVRA